MVFNDPYMEINLAKEGRAKQDTNWAVNPEALDLLSPNWKSRISAGYEHARIKHLAVNWKLLRADLNTRKISCSLLCGISVFSHKY